MNQYSIKDAFLAIVLIIFAGCSNRVAKLDIAEKAEPLMQRAAQRANEGDVESSVRLYRKALEKNPRNARAHLDLGLLLHDYNKDYVGAIYHYQRYLELRPPTEKWEMISERVRLAEQLFSVGVVTPGGGGARISDLQKKVYVLKEEVSKLRRKLAVLSSASKKTDSKISLSKKIAPTKMDTYLVRPGDSLSSIAGKAYGDSSRWKEIQAANSDILGNKELVKVGQVLMIP